MVPPNGRTFQGEAAARQEAPLLHMTALRTSFEATGPGDVLCSILRPLNTGTRELLWGAVTEPALGTHRILTCVSHGVSAVPKEDRAGLGDSS